jgi:chromosomal replication initiation ATPase DnaA
MHALEGLRFKRDKNQRRCQCGAVLSRYNQSDVCGPCRTKQIAQASKPSEPIRQIVKEVIPSTRLLELRRRKAEKILEDVGPRFKATQIINATGSVFDIDPGDIRSGFKGRNAMLARQVATYLVREEVGSSLPWIGRFIGRDHSTAIHSCRKIKHDMDANTSLKDKVEAVRALYPTMSGTMSLAFRKSTSPSRVLPVVANMFHINPERLLRKGNMRTVVVPRQIASYLLHEISKQSFPEIGRFLGQHHTTALHSWKMTRNAMESDSSVRSIVEQAKALCLQDSGVE